MQLDNAAAKLSNCPGDIGFGVGGVERGSSRVTDPTFGLSIQVRFQFGVSATPLTLPKKGLARADSDNNSHFENRPLSFLA